MLEESERNDLEQVRRIRRNLSKEAAYSALHRKYLGLVLNFLRRRGFDNEAADLAQDIFFSAFANLDSFAERSSFRTWLIAIAANRCREEWNYGRRLKRNAHRVERVNDEGVDPLELLASAAPDPGQEILEKERMARLEEAVEQLPSRMRQCWKLRVQGHDLRTIALLLKVQEGTVKAQLHKAREALAAKFGSAGVADDDS